MLIAEISTIVNGRIVTHDGGEGSGVKGHRTLRQKIEANNARVKHESEKTVKSFSINKLFNPAKQKMISNTMNKIKEKGLVLNNFPVDFYPSVSNKQNNGEYHRGRTLEDKKAGKKVELPATIHLAKSANDFTVIHEYGHHIDKIMGGENSSKYWSEEAFEKFTGKKEDYKEAFADLFTQLVFKGNSNGLTINDVPKEKREEFHTRFEKEVKNFINRNNKTQDSESYLDFQGLKIHIENPKGSVRKGEDDSGETWETKMFYPYGEIIGTEGTDGDAIDCFIGPNKDAQDAFIIWEKETGEDKCMLGFGDQLHARDAFLSHYDDSKYLGQIIRMKMEDFKEKIKHHKKGTRLT